MHVHQRSFNSRIMHGMDSVNKKWPFFWFWIINQLPVTGIKMSITFLILTQGLLKYSMLIWAYDAFFYFNIATI